MSHLFYKPAKSRLHRSELAVPGSNPKMFEKALKSNADYIFLDLEDAVSPNDKIDARKNVINAIKEAGIGMFYTSIVLYCGFSVFLGMS